MKILANDGISDLGKQLLEEAGFTVITDKVAQEELANAVNEQGIEMIFSSQCNNSSQRSD